MPELPEVETIVRELSEKITGKKLSGFSVFDAERLEKPRLVFPLTVEKVSRHGKYIVCTMRNGPRCLAHLRMTGEFLIVDKKSTIQDIRQEHERARFHFSDGSALRFVDVRRFGTINWLKKGDGLPALGVDPLSSRFTAEALGGIAGNSRRFIKPLLLDQRKIAGIGNIYADEALWFAKIHPGQPANSLEAHEITALTGSVRQVLSTGIKKGGFTLRDYRRIDGSFGYYQKSRKAYDREGLPCFRCGAKIKRIKIGGRSSYYCGQCQKIKN